MRAGHRLVIAIILLTLSFSGRAQQEIYDNAQYNDAVPMQVLSRVAPKDEEEDKATPPADSQEALACIKLFGTQQCAPEEKEVAASLVRSGPAEISLDSPAKPSVTGFVRNHWPVVVDFRPEPGTMTVLKIRLYHRRFIIPFLEVADRKVIDFDSTGGRRVAVVPALDLAETTGGGTDSDLRVASYAIRSYRLKDGVPERRFGRLVRAPVEVFGIGAGPHAVGSLTLKNVIFGPRQVRIPGQGQAPFIARYSYLLERDYDLVTATLARCRQTCLEESKPLAAPPPTHGLWTGNWLVNSSARPNDYAIVIRAWLNCGGVSAADQLRACGDKAAWAFGRAKPVTLFR